MVWRSEPPTVNSLRNAAVAFAFRPAKPSPTWTTTKSPKVNAEATASLARKLIERTTRADTIAEHERRYAFIWHTSSYLGLRFTRHRIATQSALSMAGYEQFVH